MIYEELEKLNDLKERQIITEEEFKIEKDKILNGNKGSNTSYKSLINGKKSRLVAGILGILLGWLGIHNFYLGYNEKAIAQLLITALSFGLLSWISGVWGLIEGIMILTGGMTRDGHGDPLGE